MAAKKKYLAFAAALLLLFTSNLIFLRLPSVFVLGDPQVPCFFIFGDSLSDSGNNNDLSSLAKANFLPYGVDFPGGPTGRFTNGRTTVDLIGEHLGLDTYIPPFASVSDPDVVKGVNYASGSSGILKATGSGVGGRISMDQQLKNHQEIISKISGILGKDKVDDHMSKCLYSVYAGSNDYMLNYFMSQTVTTVVTVGIVQQSSTPEQFTDSLISPYTQQLKTLYGLGARKVVVFGLGPLGCLPLLNQTGKCSDKINNALQVFNTKIKALVGEFNRDLAGAQFTFVDTMRIVSPDLSNLGLRVTGSPCCGVRQIFCLPYTSPCSDRNAYAFWDNAHPTEVANKVLASGAYSARDPNDVYPVDIEHLVSSRGNTNHPGSGVSSQASKLEKMTMCISIVLARSVLLRF